MPMKLGGGNIPTLLPLVSIKSTQNRYPFLKLTLCEAHTLSLNPPFNPSVCPVLIVEPMNV
jgi:hypothetical protein